MLSALITKDQVAKDAKLLFSKIQAKLTFVRSDLVLL